MSFHHLLQNMKEQIFIQPIDQHFQRDELIEDYLDFQHKDNLYELCHIDDSQNIDVKFYFHLDEQEESNDVSTVDESDECETISDIPTGENKKTSIFNMLNCNEEGVKVETVKIRNETLKECKMFQLQIQNKIKLMNQIYQMQMNNYLNLINSSNANNLNKCNVSTLKQK